MNEGFARRAVGRGPGRWDVLGTTVLLLALLVLTGRPAWAQPAPKRVVLVLCDALSLDDLRDNRYPHLYQLAESGALGLMNTAVAGAKTPTAAVLTLALGQQQPARPEDELAFDVTERAPEERGAIAEVYRQRSGFNFPPNRQIAHLGIESLKRRELNEVTLGAALAGAQSPRRAVVCGNADTDRPQRRVALLGIDARGVASGDVALMQVDPAHPTRHLDANVETLSRYAAESDAALFVLQLGDTARLKAARTQMSPAAYGQARTQALLRLDLFLYLLQTRLADQAVPTDVLLVAPYPDTDAEYHLPGWGRLAPVLAFGPDFPPGLLISPTTRTAGLVANIDVAPTILRLLDCPVPVTMVGRAFHSAPGQDGPHRLAALARQDFMAVLDTQASTQVTVLLGFFCFFGILGGMIARRWRGARAARLWAPMVIFTAHLPVGLLLGSILVPPTVLEYGLRIAAWMAALTLLTYLLARPLRLSPPVVSVLLGLIVLVVDILTGQSLMKDSPISSSALGGVRYYGVGNEYLGVLMAMALGGGFAWLDDRALQLKTAHIKTTHIKTAHIKTTHTAQHRDLITLWVVLLLLLGWPGLGANAGSLVVTVAGFGAGIAVLRGRRPTWKLWLACVVVGLLLSFAFSALDAALVREGGSHAGRALRAATHGRGGGYLLEIIGRKLLMNVRLLFYPYLLLGAAGVTATVLAARALIGGAVQEALRRRVWLARGLATLPAVSAATLLFKDSGLVSLAYLLGGVCVIVLWYALTTEDALTDEKREF